MQCHLCTTSVAATVTTDLEDPVSLCRFLQNATKVLKNRTWTVFTRPLGKMNCCCRCLRHFERTRGRGGGRLSLVDCVTGLQEAMWLANGLSAPVLWTGLMHKYIDRCTLGGSQLGNVAAMRARLRH